MPARPDPGERRSPHEGAPSSPGAISSRRRLIRSAQGAAPFGKSPDSPLGPPVPPGADELQMPAEAAVKPAPASTDRS